MEEEEPSQFSQPYAFNFQTGDEGESQSQQINFVDDDDEGMTAGLAPTQDGEGMTYMDDSLMTGAASQLMTGADEGGLDAPIIPTFDENAAPYEPQDGGELGGPAAPSDGPLNFVEDYAGELEASTPAELPPWKCEYCNIHT